MDITRNPSIEEIDKEDLRRAIDDVEYQLRNVVHNLAQITGHGKNLGMDYYIQIVNLLNQAVDLQNRVDLWICAFNKEGEPTDESVQNPG